MAPFSVKKQIKNTGNRILFTALSALLFLQPCRAIAQGFSVNTSGTPADPSAMMDISSTTRGMLAPRMTTAQRNTIATPATGLLIFQTDGTPGFYYYNGSAWVAVSAVAGAAGGDLTGSYPNPTLTTSGVTAGTYGSGTTTPVITVDVKGRVTSATSTAISVASPGWLLTGNAGTNPATNFMGTSDNNALRFKVNNTWAGELNPYGNTSYGLNAGRSVTTGGGITAIGNGSLRFNTSGTNNTGVGQESLDSNTTGLNNTATGYQSMMSNSTGNDNTATGYQSLYSNSTGGGNTASGYQSLLSNNTGHDNVANGHFSLENNNTGDFNTANGAYSMVSNTSGTDNTATGGQSLQGNTSGNYNTADGMGSLTNNVSGSENTALGYGSLATNTGGNDNTAIGFNADVSTGSLINATAIGNGAVVSASNTAVIGNTYVTDVYLGSTAGTAIVHADGSALTNLDAGNLATGTVASARMGSGTASSSTFLRGDNTWDVPTASGSAGGDLTGRK